MKDKQEVPITVYKNSILSPVTVWVMEFSRQHHCRLEMGLWGVGWELSVQWKFAQSKFLGKSDAMSHSNLSFKTWYNYFRNQWLKITKGKFEFATMPRSLSLVGSHVSLSHLLISHYGWLDTRFWDSESKTLSKENLRYMIISSLSLISSPTKLYLKQPTCYLFHWLSIWD